MPPTHLIIRGNDKAKAKKWMAWGNARLLQLKRAFSPGQTINEAYTPAKDVLVILKAAAGVDTVYACAIKGGGTCKNDFEVYDNDSTFPNDIWLTASYWNDDGKKVKAGSTSPKDNVDGHFVFGDTNLAMQSPATGQIRSRQMDSAGEFDITLYSRHVPKAVVDREIIQERYPMNVLQFSWLISLDTEGFGNSYGVFIFPMTTEGGKLATVTIDGAIYPYVYNGLNSEATGTIIIPRATGEVMTFLLTSDGRFFASPSQQFRYGISFTKYKCLAETTKTITVPSVDPLPDEFI